MKCEIERARADKYRNSLSKIFIDRGYAYEMLKTTLNFIYMCVCRTMFQSNQITNAQFSPVVGHSLLGNISGKYVPSTCNQFSDSKEKPFGFWHLYVCACVILQLL